MRIMVVVVKGKVKFIPKIRGSTMKSMTIAILRDQDGYEADCSIWS
jgi:predicted aconitase with swiveling domain